MEEEIEDVWATSKIACYEHLVDLIRYHGFDRLDPIVVPSVIEWMRFQMAKGKGSKGGLGVHEGMKNKNTDSHNLGVKDAGSGSYPSVNQKGESTVRSQVAPNMVGLGPRKA